MFDLLDVGWDEALSWMRGLAAVGDEEFEQLSADAKRQAFWMAGITRQQVAADALEILEEVTAQGLPDSEWRRRAMGMLAEHWGDMTQKQVNARMRLILVNWTQNAYGEANWDEITDPDVTELRPYLMFDAVRDAHTSPICRECDGTVLHHADPWWKTHRPPMHHSCRSQVISLSERQAQRFGITKKLPDPKIKGDWGAGRAYIPGLPPTLNQEPRPE